MRAVDIIIKKREGEELSREEIDFFVNGFTRGEIPDYQASAWAMAVLLKGMTDRETTDLSLAMADSGEILDLSDIAPMVVDKHSTGGVGDKTTLVVAPVVAACGLHVGKMSGRGLGFSGGTLDKLESIRGYRVDLNVSEFRQQLKEIGLVLTGQSADLAPADGKLYALRDVTGTVPCIPLIASSIMSKKIASGANVIVLDVKTGLGAFMTNLEEARKLGRMMVAIGKLSGRKVRAILSDMNQPLGEAVGNAIELKEAIHTLQGGGPSDFYEHCVIIAAHLLEMGGKAGSLDEGRQMVKNLINNGKALDKFKLLVKAQGGDVSYIEKPEKLPTASFLEPVLSSQSGYLAMINPKTIAEATILMGAGRSKKTDPIDHRVGVITHCKVGDHVDAGTQLFTIHAEDRQKVDDVKRQLLSSIRLSAAPVEPLPLFYDVIM
jgi:pyrimidine-nucleoside phosphorylase